MFGANLNSLTHMIRLVKPGGFGAVEDITAKNVGLWLAHLHMLRSKGFDFEIISCTTSAFVFCFASPHIAR